MSLRKEFDRTSYALVGRYGLVPFVDVGAQPSRGMRSVNTITTPLVFSVHGNTLYSINNSGVVTVIGTLQSVAGNVSMADDGTYLVLVDGVKGYYYNMIAPAGLIQITDGNFTTTPKTVTWQDTYFIVTSGATNQFQLSANADPSTWPAVQINFTGTQGGALQAGIADHSILHLFGDTYSEFWQNTGAPDFPYARIPGAAQEFGLAAAFSLAKFDNSLCGLFKNKMGGVNVSRMAGFSLNKISDEDIDKIFTDYILVGDARAYAVMFGGHPMYIVNLPGAGTSWMFDGLTGIPSELQSPDGSRFWGEHFANLQDQLLVSDRRNGMIYRFDSSVNDDGGETLAMEVISKHIWQDDKYIGIQQVQVDFESGTGTVSGQGVNPVVDLQVSKDGGNSFYSVGFSTMGKIGEFTQRIVWRTLGASRDWVLKLRITDPVKRIITGASAEVTGASF